MSNENEALALAVIEHLGPHALAGDKMTLLEAFERGWKAHAAASQVVQVQQAPGKVTLRAMHANINPPKLLGYDVIDEQGKLIGVLAPEDAQQVQQAAEPQQKEE